VKSLWRLLLIVACFFTTGLSASQGEKKMLKADQKYIEYKNFGIFSLKIDRDYGSSAKYLALESDITESTMHVNEYTESNRNIPTVKRFYKKLELYFDGNNEPSIIMDLASLRFENSISVPTKIITDGYVADSLKIKLSRADLQKFRKLKPETAQVILYDGDGKIVTVADVSIDKEQ
jgi:hypothetical protein